MYIVPQVNFSVAFFTRKLIDLFTDFSIKTTRELENEGNPKNKKIFHRMAQFSHQHDAEMQVALMYCLKNFESRFPPKAEGINYQGVVLL